MTSIYTSMAVSNHITKSGQEPFLRHFAQSFVTGMLDHTMAGQPRTSRRYRTNNTCPVPTLADTRRFMLTYVKQPPIQAVPGPLLGMSHAHTNTGIHWRRPVLNQAVGTQHDFQPEQPQPVPRCSRRLGRTEELPPPLFSMVAANARSAP